MPHYEYRCATCEAHFDLLRPVADADAPAGCPDGHVGARRLISVFAAGGRSSAAAPTTSGGCCGGSCGCG